MKNEEELYWLDKVHIRWSIKGLSDQPQTQLEDLINSYYNTKYIVTNLEPGRYMVTLNLLSKEFQST